MSVVLSVWGAAVAVALNCCGRLWFDMQRPTDGPLLVGLLAGFFTLDKECLSGAMVFAVFPRQHIAAAIWHGWPCCRGLAALGFLWLTWLLRTSGGLLFVPVGNAGYPLLEWCQVFNVFDVPRLARYVPACPQCLGFVFFCKGGGEIYPHVLYDGGIGSPLMRRHCKKGGIFLQRL